MAAALIDSQALPAQFTDERAADPVLESLRDRIDFDEDPSLPRRAVRVTLELTDGRTYTERMDHPTGTPGNPMSDTMVQEKFHGLASAVLGVKKADEAQSALWSVDAMPDVSRLIPLLLE